MTRRELWASLAGGALLVTFGACGGDDVSSDAGVSCTENGANADFTQNHGHVLVISVADIAAGVERTYDIMGTSLHTHSVTITSEQFAMLQTNRSITAMTTVTSSHSHSVVVLCA
jgi:hypothetical protein